LNQPAGTTEKGPGFTVDQNRMLSSHVINRRFTIPLGLLCLLISGGGLYLAWQDFLTGHQRTADYASWSIWLLPVGLVVIGIRKRVIVDCTQKRVRVSSGWFCLSLSRQITSRWDLARFDRIVIQRGRRLGFTAPGANTPQQNNWNMRYRVKLMGDHEVIVNSYGAYHDARRLSLVLASMTGFALHEVNSSGF